MALDPCNQCLFTSCAAVMNACVADPACTAYFKCDGACGADAACSNACKSTYASGLMHASEVSACAVVSCSSTCH
jgi:hypothetical protein